MIFINQYKKRDSRKPKEILNNEIFITVPMIMTIMNCTYDQALIVIKEGIKIEKDKKLYRRENTRVFSIRTTTLKELLNL